MANLSVQSPGKGTLDIFRILCVFSIFFLAEDLRTLAPHLSSEPQLYVLKAAAGGAQRLAKVKFEWAPGWENSFHGF